MTAQVLTLLAGAALACTLFTARPAGAADLPSPPIRLVVPGAAGSPPDTVARTIADAFAAQGRGVVIDNRPGAIGTLAYGAVAKAAPDGRTLAIVGLPYVIVPSWMDKMPYDPARDLTVVARLVWTANLLVVRTSSPLKSVADLVATAKAKPGSLTHASAGIGTPSHLAGELFKHHAGIQALHVPYKGIPAGLVDVVGEQVDFAFAGIAAALPLIKAGKLRALGTAGAQRLPALPDLPTIAESGFTGYGLNEWYGIAAPAGMPPEAIAVLAGELARVVALPHVKASLEQVGLYPRVQSDPDALAALVRTELERWRRIVRETGIRGE
jgi:tripartite-type tricarboxylate transporter receptor subunit TctC